MKDKLLLVVGILSLVFPGAVMAKPEETPKDVKASEAAEAVLDPKMQEMMALAQPGEHHKVLEALAGNWNYTMQWWMSPEAQAQSSTGTSQNTWILGGRFLKQVVTGTHMGEPFEGINITGYDNVKGEYNSVWVDNVSTGMMTSSSQYDPVTKTFSEKGSFSCPMMQGPISFRGSIALISSDQYTYSMFSQDKEGKEYKMMEIVYTKTK